MMPMVFDLIFVTVVVIRFAKQSTKTRAVKLIIVIFIVVIKEFEITYSIAIMVIMKLFFVEVEHIIRIAMELEE